MALLISLQKIYGNGLGLVLNKEKKPDFYRVLEVLDLTETFRLFPDSAAARAALSG
jgi:hypothetical protein